jgi:hypothetical protein
MEHDEEVRSGDRRRRRKGKSLRAAILSGSADCSDLWKTKPGTLDWLRANGPDTARQRP